MFPKIWFLCTRKMLQITTMTLYERRVVSSQIIGHSTASLTAYADPYKKKHQSTHCWPFVRIIHQLPMNSLHKGPETWKRLPLITSLCLLNMWQRNKQKSTGHSMFLLEEMIFRLCAINGWLYRHCLRYPNENKTNHNYMKHGNI